MLPLLDPWWLTDPWYWGEVNTDPDSINGEEDEGGFDDMPAEAGWEDESDDDGADEEDDEADL